MIKITESDSGRAGGEHPADTGDRSHVTPERRIVIAFADTVQLRCRRKSLPNNVDRTSSSENLSRSSCSTKRRTTRLFLPNQSDNCRDALYLHHHNCRVTVPVYHGDRGSAEGDNAESASTSSSSEPWPPSQPASGLPFSSAIASIALVKCSPMLPPKCPASSTTTRRLAGKSLCKSHAVSRGPDTS